MHQRPACALVYLRASAPQPSPIGGYAHCTEDIPGTQLWQQGDRTTRPHNNGIEDFNTPFT